MHQPPFFIVGCPRTGTTLVSQALDNHSRLAVFHETQYYPVFHPHLRYYGDLGKPANAARLIGDVRDWLTLQEVEPPPPDQLAATSFEGVLAALLDAHARRLGKARGGDKTPHHHAYLREITTSFPHSPVIFLVRDPRDTVKSYCHIFGAKVDHACSAWNKAYTSYAAFADSVHTVRYEELVNDPAGVLEPVCSLLGEQYEPEMLSFHERVPERMRRLPDVGLVTSPVSSSSVGGYRELPAQVIARIEALCAEGMERLGYEFTTALPPRPATPVTPSRVSFVLERLRYYARRPDRRRFGRFRWKIALRARLSWLTRRTAR